MCGIAGAFHLNGQALVPSNLQAMARAMLHRGPDGEGIFIDDNVGLVHRRLSIVDLAGGHQPMTSADSRWTICYNGEVYNAAELRQACTSYPFQTDHSDTEAILASHACIGEAARLRLNGMFAYALWDAEQRELLLTRDPIGIKPLYVYEKDGLVVFASELQALLAYPGLDLTVNKGALPYYFSYLFIPAPLTIYQHVRQLMPGEMLQLSAQRRVLVPRQHIAPPTERLLDEATALREFDDVLHRAVDRHMMSDVPVGVFLSGGIDSSLVASIMAQRHGRQSAFTMGFPVKAYDELDTARTIADHLGLNFHSHRLQPVDVDLLPSLVSHFAEPFADASALPTYILSRFTAEQVKVVLSGEGGDELFAGYTQYAGIRWSQNYKARVPAPMRTMLRQLLGLVPKLPSSSVNFKMQRILRVLDAAELSPLQSRAQKLSVLEAGQLERLFSADMREHLASTDLVGQMAELWQAADGDDGAKLIDGLGAIDLHYYLPNDMLTKMDRMSMAHGLEVRVPLLDREVIDFAAKLDGSLKLHGQQTKYLPRKLLGQYVPEWITNLPKRGFNVPLDYWFKGGLNGYAREIIMSQPQEKADYFNMDYIDQILREHEQGRVNHGNTIWSLLMFSLWLQRAGVSTPASPNSNT